jgi:hypothetical protein
MSPNRWTLAGIIGFLTIASSHAQVSKDPDPLFQSSDILNVRISAPIRTLLKERSDEQDLDGMFQYTDDAGEKVEVSVGIRTRGISRLKPGVCQFPPLRLDFKKSQIKKSLFHKQDKLKLVTHCRDKSRRYEQTLMNEFLAYRILNQLTDISFRVRLLRITYVDTDGVDADRTAYGFLIEHKDRLSKRLGLQPLNIAKTTVRSLDLEYTNLISVFHFMIGNTDFSPIAGPEASCCHNHVLIGEEGQPLLSVPYDFDQSGLVDAPYGITNPRFRLRNAKERLYRGRCINNGYLEGSLAVYKERREAIFQLIANQEGMTAGWSKKMTKFLGTFYKVIDSPKQVERQLVKKCI